ncbi:MAG: SMP-30/gluconolactonase/LRE family protein [Nitrospirota bacterium]|nr:MAG: SMP-30/gluconolactonase/LRE family protein [Nitrospirota bacterium]
MKRISVLILLLLIPAIVNAFDQVEIKTKIGQKGSGPGQLREPSALAVDAEGLIYVADTGNNRINVMGKDGRTIATWDSKSVRGLKLNEPTGVAVYENRVYVADAFNDKIYVFLKTGKLIDEFGERGNGPKQFSNPGGIAVHQGIVYVADTDNDRVQAFSLDGIYLHSIGKSGKGLGEMRSPTDVDVDHRGYIYVSEKDNDRVGVFLPSGHHYRYYYEVKSPTAVAVDSTGFYVADMGNSRIKKINLESRMLLTFGTKGEGVAQFRDISGLAIDRDGDILVADSYKHDIQIFEPEKKVKADVEVVPPIDSVKWIGDTKASIAGLVWKKDRLFATSEDQDAILIIQNGAIRMVIKGQGNDTLRDPQGITVDARGNIWIADTGNNRIVQVNDEGRVVFTLGKSSGSSEGKFSSPQGVATSRKGFIYVADTGNERIQIFSDKGVFISKVEKIGRVDFDDPVDIDIDARGNFYVVDRGYHAVAKYDPNGKFIMYIGGQGEADGRFKNPTGATIIDNEIYVVDGGNERIQVFNLKGKYLRKFGAPGFGKGDLSKPGRIAKKDSTTLFVSDLGNDRIQELKLLRTPISPRLVTAQSGIKEVELSWKKNPEPFVGHYKVYRSQSKMGYKLIASPSTPGYKDNEIDPETTYYYKVTAVADTGNESARSNEVSARTKKVVALPPTDIQAKPDETEIVLTWKPADGESMVSHFVVYRELDGSFREIGKVKGTSFVHKGLQPKTKYNYKITAVSPNNEESQGVIIRTATILKIPPVEVSVRKMHDVFPRAYKVYESDGIGVLRLKNNTKELLEGVLVSFMTEDFMDRPAVVKIDRIMPEDSVEVDIKPVKFNDRILTLKENKAIKAEIKAVFYLDNAKKSLKLDQKLMVILTGKKYSKSQIKKFRDAMKALDNKVAKTKMTSTLSRDIRNKLDSSDSTIKGLRSDKLNYSEITVCIYISNESGKTHDTIISANRGGQQWEDLLSIFDLDIVDITGILTDLEKGLVAAKPKPKPQQRQRATDRYIK